MSNIFLSHLDKLLKAHYQATFSNAKVVRAALQKFKQQYDMNDPKVFRRLPKKELKSLLRIECPIPPATQQFRGFLDHEIKSTIKRLRVVEEIKENLVCANCSKKDKCKMKDQVPTDAKANISDLMIVLNAVGGIAAYNNNIIDSEIKIEQVQQQQNQNNQQNKTVLQSSEQTQKKEQDQKPQTLEKKEDNKTTSTDDKKSDQALKDNKPQSKETQQDSKDQQNKLQQGEIKTGNQDNKTQTNQTNETSKNEGEDIKAQSVKPQETQFDYSFKVWMAATKVLDSTHFVIEDMRINNGIETKKFINAYAEIQKVQKKQVREFTQQNPDALLKQKGEKKSRKKVDDSDDDVTQQNQDDFKKKRPKRDVSAPTQSYQQYDQMPQKRPGKNYSKRDNFSQKQNDDTKDFRQRNQSDDNFSQGKRREGNNTLRQQKQQDGQWENNNYGKDFKRGYKSGNRYDNRYEKKDQQRSNIQFKDNKERDAYFQDFNEERLSKFTQQSNLDPNQHREYGEQRGKKYQKRQPRQFNEDFEAGENYVQQERKNFTSKQQNPMKQYNKQKRPSQYPTEETEQAFSGQPKEQKKIKLNLSEQTSSTKVVKEEQNKPSALDLDLVLQREVDEKREKGRNVKRSNFAYTKTTKSVEKEDKDKKE